MKKHWNGRYILNRTKLYVFEKTHPGRPWWTKDAIIIMDQLLKSTDSVLEFGSGRSTIWLGKRCANITSIEHDQAWAKKVSEMADDAGINLDLQKPLIRSSIWKEYHEDEAVYLNILSESSKMYDLIVIDGLFRDACSIKAIQHIAPGGIILIDNVNWYLPSSSHSPSSIPMGKPEATLFWTEFVLAVKSWRKIVTSNGVTDTAIFFAPENKS